MSWFDQNAPKAGGFFEQNAPKSGSWFDQNAPADTVAVENAQHPELSNVDRTLINTLEDDPEKVSAWLQKKGFETRIQDGEVVMKKGTDPKWYKVEKTGWLPNEWSDITDLANEAASIWGMTKGAALGGAGGTAVGGPVGSVVGGLAGAGAGAAAAETARKGAAQAAGFDQTLGDVVKDVALEGAFGAAGEGAGKAVGWAAKKTLPKLKSLFVTPRSKNPYTKLGPSLGTEADVGLKRSEGVRILNDLKEQRIKEGAKAEVEEIEALLRELPESVQRTSKVQDDIAFAKATPRATSGRAIEDLTSEQWKKVEDFIRTRGTPLPDFAVPKATNYPARAFRMTREQSRKYLDRIPEENVKDLAQQLGIDVANLDRQALVQRMTKNAWKFEDLLAQKRKEIHDMIDLFGQSEGPGGVFEATFRKVTNGNMRHMRAMTNAPISAEPYSAKVVQEWVNAEIKQGNIANVRSMAKRIWRDKKPSLRKKAAIDRMDAEKLAETIYKGQKAGFSTGLGYNPRLYGNRIVWDVDSSMWRTIPTDFLHEIRFPGKKSLSFTTPHDYPKKELHQKIGQGMRWTGELVRKPADMIQKGVSGVLGMASPEAKKFAHFLAPTALTGFAVGASAGTIPTVLAAGQIGGGVLSAAGRWLMRTSGADLSKSIAKALQSAPAPVKKTAQAILAALREYGEETARAMVYVVLSQDPEFREWFDRIVPEDQEQD